MKAVINICIADLQGKTCPYIDTAMYFILSDNCEIWCIELGLNYIKLKEKASELYERHFRRRDAL